MCFAAYAEAKETFGGMGLPNDLNALLGGSTHTLTIADEAKAQLHLLASAICFYGPLLNTLRARHGPHAVADSHHFLPLQILLGNRG